MSTQLDTDIAMLVGEMPVIGCEHSQHGDPRFHDDGPATHYVQPGHHCGAKPAMYAACSTFIHSIIAGTPGYCSNCGTPEPLNHIITILGPVNK